MRKKIILKTIVNFIFLAVVIYSITCIVQCFIKIDDLKEQELLIGEFSQSGINASRHIKYFLKYKNYELIFFLICAACNFLCFLIINLKDLQFLTNSLIKTIKEHRASTAEQRKAKKQAKLQAEIAEKQAKLDEMKKDITE